VLVFVIFPCRFWQMPEYFHNYAMAVDIANKEKEVKITYRLKVRGFKMYDKNREIDRWTLKEPAGGGGGGGTRLQVLKTTKGECYRHCVLRVMMSVLEL
jgi:hypothetical protein